MFYKRIGGTTTDPAYLPASQPMFVPCRHFYNWCLHYKTFYGRKKCYRIGPWAHLSYSVAIDYTSILYPCEST
jgi:hypothetical protein